MKGLRLFAISAVCLWLAGGLQEALAPRLSIGGIGPDFYLVVIAVLGLNCDPRGGAYLGFTAGLLEGAIAGANLGAYVVTRCLVGFFCATTGKLEFEVNPFLAAALAALITVGAQIGLMFLSPPGAIVHFLIATIGSAVVNGVLAMPLHLVVKRLSDPYNR